MKNKDEFYIGWMPMAPASYAFQVKKAVITIGLACVLVVVLYAFSQKQFENGVYESDIYKSIQGVIYTYPVPMLKVKTSANQYQNFLLFGFGKSDAHQVIERLKNKLGEVENYLVTLESELIYYDGKTLLEVPQDHNQMNQFAKLSTPMPERKIESMGEMTLKGEIVDPKCFFGVMKPGYGKIHRSCAIRCIAGGIPPVFVAKNQLNESEYFIVIGKDGKPVNQQILQSVGIPVTLKGEVEKVDDWWVFKIDPVSGISLDPKNSRSAWYLADENE